MAQVIFLVEDDPDVRLLLNWVLSDAFPQYRLHEAASGRAFLTLLEQQTPDLVLLDVQLPDMDGLSLYNFFRLRHGLKGVPVLFVTANPHLVREAGPVGPYGCLAKPFNNANIVKHVQLLLDPNAASESVSA